MSLLEIANQIALETSEASQVVKNYCNTYSAHFGVHQETAFPDIQVRETRRYKTYRPPWEGSDFVLGYVSADKVDPGHTELKVRRIKPQF